MNVKFEPGNRLIVQFASDAPSRGGAGSVLATFDPAADPATLPLDEPVSARAIGVESDRLEGLIASSSSEQGDGLPDIPEDGKEYTLQGRDNIGQGGSNDPIKYWRTPNYVPDGPGTQSGIGRVLEIFGEGDTDYRWGNNTATEDRLGRVQGASAGQATANSGTTFLAWSVSRLRALVQAALPTVSADDATTGTSSARRAWTAQRVRQAINAVTNDLASRITTLEGRPAGGGGTDQVARDAATAAQATADAANTRSNANTREVRTAREETAANKAVLDGTVILEMHPAVIFGGNKADATATYHLSVQTPSPIEDAVSADIWWGDNRVVPVSRGGFSATAKQQTIQYELSDSNADNLLNGSPPNTDSSTAPQGYSPSAERCP